MPIPPKPYKLECPKCGYSKVVKIRSDALTPTDLLQMSSTCPKCGSQMEKKEVSLIEKIFFKGW